LKEIEGTREKLRAIERNLVREIEKKEIGGEGLREIEENWGKLREID